MTTSPRPCARCDQDIPAARAEALPETEVCVTCSKEPSSGYSAF